MIQDREVWAEIRAQGMTRYLLVRALLAGGVASLGYVASHWGALYGVQWESVLKALVLGLIGGAVWGYWDWRLRESAFERNG